MNESQWKLFTAGRLLGVTSSKSNLETPSHIIMVYILYTLQTLIQFLPSSPNNPSMPYLLTVNILVVPGSGIVYLSLHSLIGKYDAESFGLHRLHMLLRTDRLSLRLIVFSTLVYDVESITPSKCLSTLIRYIGKIDRKSPFSSTEVHGGSRALFFSPFNGTQ